MIRQAMYPHGLQGKLFATVMEGLNGPAYRCAASLIDPAGRSVLEIGFGTGALLARLAERLPGGWLAGLDPSPLMVQWARRRLVRHAERIRVDLRQGSDQDIDWPAATFAHVAALHSFQFWASPELTLCRIRQVLRADGQLLLIVRSHARRRPQWLPNALSRSADEIGGLIEALQRAGFSTITRHSDVGTSAVLTAGGSGALRSSEGEDEANVA